MRKLFLFLVIGALAVSLYAQHRVNDIAEYGGWFKVKVEIFQSGEISYTVNQCYPSGEDYLVADADKNKLPLYFKVLCIGMIEEGLGASFDFGEMIMNEDGFNMKLSAFSFTFEFKITKSEEEILDALGEDTVNAYKDRSW